MQGHSPWLDLSDEPESSWRQFLEGLVLNRERRSKNGCTSMVALMGTFVMCHSFQLSYASALISSTWFPSMCFRESYMKGTLTITFRLPPGHISLAKKMLSRVGKLLPLLFSISVLICLVLVFVGCTSTSSPHDLYFLRVS
jgi:hypothetical protein